MSGAITLQGKTQETDFKEDGRVYVNNATRQPGSGALAGSDPNRSDRKRKYKFTD